MLHEPFQVVEEQLWLSSNTVRQACDEALPALEIRLRLHEIIENINFARINARINTLFVFYAKVFLPIAFDS